MQLAFVQPTGSPIHRQYRALKEQHPASILFFQLGDFYETFEDDARTVAEVCDVTLTAREMGRGERLPMAGVPVHAAETYIARLVESGHHIAVCQQIDDSSDGPRTTSALVRREVTRVITPGTLVDTALLAATRPNYLAALIAERNRVGLAFADISTGEFSCTEVDGSGAAEVVRAELWRLQPAECLALDERSIEGLELSAMPTTFDDEALSQAEAEHRLCAHFGVASRAALGLGDGAVAARAAALILRYLDRTQPRAAIVVDRLRVYDARGYMVIDPVTRERLELTRGPRSRREGSLLHTLDQTHTAMGARLLASWIGHPLLDRQTIETRLDRVAAFVNEPRLRTAIQQALDHVPDLERLASRASQQLLTPREALALATGIGASSGLRAALAEADPDPITQIVERIDPPVALAEEIRATLADNPPASFGDGMVRPGVDAELDELRSHSSDSRRWLIDLERRERERTGVKNLKVGYNRVFGYYLEVSSAALRQSLDYYRQQESGAQTVAELLQRLGYQRRQTLASAERFVTDELRDHEARQARSAARTADLERQAFEGLCERIAAQSSGLTSTARALSEVDALASLAQVAHERRYVRPEIVYDSVTEIVAGRHPVVEAAIGWDAYIADDAFLAQGPSPERQGEPSQVLVLTGPNMAGKTTFGRMVLLVALMGQCGSFVPAQRARLGIVDRIFLRSGAGDDIAGGQSTFMAEMTETAAILLNASSRSLAFFDEVGRGTSTYDGMAIARSIVEHLADPEGGCRTIFSTHYHELAAIELELPTAQSFRMDVLETQSRVVFTYRVVRGGADRSYGVHVAQLAGLPASVIARAAQVLQDLEAGSPRSGDDDQQSGGCDDGNERSGEGAAAQRSLLYELADVNLDEMTPLEGLNTLASLQRAVRRWLVDHGAR